MNCKTKHFLYSIFCSCFILAKAFAYNFPEEADRGPWDRGCEDWPPKVQLEDWGLPKNPSVRVEKNSGLLRILAQMKLRPEKGEDFNKFQKSIELLLANGFRYPLWVLPGVNDKPGGGQFFITLDALTGAENTQRSTFVLTGPYTFHLFWFKKSGHSSLEFKKELMSPPPCEVFSALSINKNSPRVTKFTYRMTPRVDILHWLMAEMYIVPEQDKVGVYFRLVGKPAPLLYELIPASLLRTELEARGTRVFQNFVDLRRTLYLDEMKASLKSGARSSPSRGVAPVEKVR